jgi:hypothetical protein
MYGYAAIVGTGAGYNSYRIYGDSSGTAKYCTKQAQKEKLDGY